MQQRVNVQKKEWDLREQELLDRRQEWESRVAAMLKAGKRSWTDAEDRYLTEWRDWEREFDRKIEDGNKEWDERIAKHMADREQWEVDLKKKASEAASEAALTEVLGGFNTQLQTLASNAGIDMAPINLNDAVEKAKSQIIANLPTELEQLANINESIERFNTNLSLSEMWGTDTQSALAGLATDFRNEMGNFQKQMVIYGNAKILEQYQKLMSDLLEQIERQNKAIEQQTEMAALGAGFVKSGNTFIKQSKLVSTAIGMVAAYQWYDGKAALDGYLSSIGAGYGGRIIWKEDSNGEKKAEAQSRDSVMADLPSFLETADTVEVESFFGVQKLILQKAFEKIMGTGTVSERKISNDKEVIGDLAFWIGKPAGSSEFVTQIGQAAPHLGAKEQKKLGMGENVTGLDVLKYLADPGFGELGEGGNRPSGIYLGFYNKLDLVSRYIDGKNSDRIESISSSIDPISATMNQFNPVSMLATSIQNVRVASEVYGKDAGYMWEAQLLGAVKGALPTIGTAVAAAFSWTGVGIAIGAAIIASGNAIQVDTKTGSRDAVMNDRAAVGTAIGIASMYAGNLTSGANVGAADRLMAAAINTSASSIGAGFSYNDHGNITGWTLSGSNGDAFWQNMGTGALSAGISEGVIKGFGIQNDYAKDIISSVSGAGVNTFAEYYKYDHGYQNNYAAMANPDIGNASAFWGLAVAMGSRAVSGGSSTDATSSDWSWDNAMEGFGEGFLGEFTGWVGLGSALANKTGQVYSMVSGLFGMARRKEEEVLENNFAKNGEFDPETLTPGNLDGEKGYWTPDGKFVSQTQLNAYWHARLSNNPEITMAVHPVFPDVKAAQNALRWGMPNNPDDFLKEGWLEDAKGQNDPTRPKSYTRIIQIPTEDGLHTSFSYVIVNPDGTYNYELIVKNSRGEVIQSLGLRMAYINGAKKMLGAGYSGTDGRTPAIGPQIPVAWYTQTVDDRGNSYFTLSHWEIYDLNTGNILGVRKLEGNFLSYDTDPEAFPDIGPNGPANFYRDIMPGFYQGQQVDWGSSTVPGTDPGFHVVYDPSLLLEYGPQNPLPWPVWNNWGPANFNQPPRNPQNPIPPR